MSNQTEETRTRRCISLKQGNLSPDMRVNYVFGLVLGVDEFTQEQEYHLRKNFLHHRGLHGYGAVSGLRVALKPVGEGDIEISVGEGIGVDQLGRAFAVREKQCARLKAWLEQNNLTADYASPSEDDARKSLYVVAQYDTCEAEQVPIAGEPCGSGEQNRAPSRLKDTVNIKLQQDAPNMAAWIAVQRFALLMERVDRDPSIDSGDIEKALEFVQLLDQPEELASRLNNLGNEKLKLSRDDLNKLMNTWVAEVRPRLAPSVLDADMEEQEAAVLLARIDFKATGDSTAEKPRFESVGVDHSTRPYLLHTQLIQSLLSSSGETLPDVRHFLHFKTFSGEKNTVSFYLEPENLNIPGSDALELRRNEAEDPISSFDLVQSGGRADLLWQLKLNRAELKDGDVLSFRFDTDQLSFPETGQTLTEWMKAENVHLIGYDGEHHIHAIHLMEAFPEQQPTGLSKDEVSEMIDAVRTLPLVTITTRRYRTQPPSLECELWFHVDMQPDVYEGEVEEPRVRLFLEAGERRLFEANTEIEKVRPNLFRLIATHEAIAEIPEQLYYARFVFPLNGIQIKNADGTFDNLHTFMKKYTIKFDGYYMRLREDGEALILYERIPVDMEAR